MRGKQWCFTLNNWTEEEYNNIISLFDKAKCKYLVLGKEKGEQGTPHLQGYISFHKRESLRSAKTMLGARVHLEQARGSPQQNLDYCSKDGDFVTYGEISKCRSGHRSDLDKLRETVDDDPERALSTIRETDYGAYLRYQKALNQDIQRAIKNRNEPPRVLVYWGDTGTGKSRAAFEGYPQAFAKPAGKWWDGYENEEVVILDEFTGGWWPITYMLCLLDRYPFKVEVKGGYRKFTSKTIVITSNICPREWWPEAREAHKLALERRLNEFGRVTHFNHELMNKPPET